MASLTGIGGVNDSYSSSLRGLSGLTGGFDRDEMIKTMTLRSRTRIAGYKQKLQRARWKQESYREVSDKLIELTRKYLSIGSDNSLIRSSTFNDYTIESIGDFKNKVSASGSPGALQNLEIMGASDRAVDTSYSSERVNGTNGVITSGKVDFTAKAVYGAFAGKTMDIDIGLKDKAESYTVKFKSGDYDIYKRNHDGSVVKDADGFAELDQAKVDKVKKLFSDSFKSTEVTIGRNKYTMDDFIKVDFVKNKGTKDYQVRIKVKDNNVSNGGKALGDLNAMTITGGTLFKGVSGVNGVGSKGVSINNNPNGFNLADTARAMIGGYREGAAPKEKSVAQMLLGESMTFNVNGQRRTIKFPDTQIPNADPASKDVNVKKDGIIYNLATGQGVADYLNQELRAAYGKDMISVSYDASTQKMTFDPKGSTLTIKGESGHLLGEASAFNMADGIGNRLDLKTNLREAAGSPIMDKLNSYAVSKGRKDFADLLRNTDSLEFNINGNKINVKTAKINTLEDLLKQINNPENIEARGKSAGGTYNSIFNVEYNSSGDSFVFTSKDKGSGTQLADSNKLWEAGSIEDALFGSYDANRLTAGRDATLFYKDGRSDEIHKVTSNDNQFQIGEAKISIKGKFNVTNTPTGMEVADKTATGVTFNSKLNSDNLVKTVKGLIKDYNEIVKLIGKKFTTAHERTQTGALKYDALTDEQKAKMSEKQIENWEKEAKKGLLFSDTVLRGTRDSLLSSIYYNEDSVALLAKIGITQAKYSSDANGSLEFDEAKFKKALAENPKLVEKAFIGDGGSDKGFANNLKNVIARSASDVGSYKGTLVEVAGSKYAPASLFKNSMFKEMDALKKVIANYETRLKNDQDRYIKRFAHLEKIMMKANMQAGYITGQQGY